jgi:Fe-S cluster assembly protein SufD
LPAETRDRYLAAFERVGRSRKERPLWLRRLREEALARFLEAGFPTVKHEDWKYTGLDSIEQGEFDTAEPGGGDLSPADIAGILPGEEADRHVLVFLNGRYRPELSMRRDLPPGAHLGSLTGALGGEFDGLVPYFSRSTETAFTDLNTMLMEDGVFLHLAKDVRVPEPVYLLFLMSPGARPVMAHPRNLIIAGENSGVTVVEQYAGRGDPGYFVNSVTDIAAGRNAAIVHYRLQEEGPAACHVAALRVRQGTGSRFAAHSVSFGALLSRHDVHAVLDGEGAECMLNGLYLGNGRQHVDHFTTIDHAKPSGASREYYNGILNDRARGVFRGRLIVRRDAQKTDARQTNRNLLLSRESEADSRPQLEIHADDVKCTHGATIGPLDEDKLFYIRSRGIDEASAKGLLTYAFAGEILRRFDLSAFRGAIEEKLLAWLPEAQQVQEFLRETGK